MHNRFLWRGAIVTAACFAMNLNAQVPSIEDFAKRSQISDIALSPTGNEIAMTVPSADGLESRLEIVPLTDTGKGRAFRFGPQMHVTDIVWTADDRLVVSKADMEPLKAAPYSQGELFTTDSLGEDQDMLFGYVPDNGIRRGRRKDQGFAAVSQLVKSQPGVALVSFRCWNCGEEPDTTLFRVDTRTGERKEVERFRGATDFFADNEGVARVAVGADGNDEPLIKYRPTPDAAWLPLPKALAGYSMEPLRIAPDANTLYALISDSKEPEQLYRLDLAAGTRERLAGRANMDVGRVLFQGSKGAPFAVFYDAGKPSVDYIDKTSEWTQLHAGLMKLFPGELVSFVNFSRDDNTVLFATYSDRHPGAYYVIDRGTSNIRLIGEIQPEIDPKLMASTRPVEFKGRDGRTLFGFYTAKTTGPHPMIVIPHGGPFGVYDRWGFDSDVQYLASRGYGVLQVNFRGSGGRGQSFLESGYREWGGAIQDDIADGVQWAIDNKLAEADRICIYGASFGGYAALMNPIRYPDLYQCAIGYVGVYDLALMFDAGDIKETKIGRRYLDRVLGSDTAILTANSPAKQVEKIQLPVFLAQGAVDRRVPMQQFDALVDAFRANGRPVETLVVKGEGHGFQKPENRVRLYQQMETFLDKYLGAEGTGAGAP